MKTLRRTLACLVATLILATTPIVHAGGEYPNSVEEFYACSQVVFGMDPVEVIQKIGDPSYANGTNGVDLSYVYSLGDTIVDGIEGYIMTLRFDSSDALYLIEYMVGGNPELFDPFVVMLCDSGFGQKVEPIAVSTLPSSNTDGATLEFLPVNYGRYALCQFKYGNPITELILTFVPDASYLEPLPTDFDLDELVHEYGLTGDLVKATGNVNVRDTANTAGKSRGTLKKGETAEFLGESMTDDRGVKWYKVMYKSQYGWVSSKYGEVILGNLPNAGVNEQSYAIVTETYTHNGKKYATFDYVDLHFFSPGTKNADGVIMDHDGVDVVNKNPKLRTFEIAANCAFIMPIFNSLDHIDLSENQQVDYQHFKTHYGDIAYGVLPMIFSVTIQNSKVAKCELWYDYYIGG